MAHDWSAAAVSVASATTWSASGRSGLKDRCEAKLIPAGPFPLTQRPQQRCRTGRPGWPAVLSLARGAVRPGPGGGVAGVSTVRNSAAMWISSGSAYAGSSSSAGGGGSAGGAPGPR